MDRTVWPFLTSLICLLAASCAVPPATTNLPDAELFTFNGKPIHPACVMTLEPSLADLLPTVAAVDLDGCAKSNQFWNSSVVANKCYYRILMDGQGYFQYRCLGVVHNDIFVLDTELSGGGSGVFRGLLFVRLATDQVWESGKARRRTQLVACGSYDLGDRDERPIAIENGRVLVNGLPIYPPQ